MDNLSGAAAARETSAWEKMARLEEANAELLAANAALEQQVRAPSSLAWPLVPCLFAHSVPVYLKPTHSPHPHSWPGHSVLSQRSFSVFEVSSGDNLSAFQSNLPVCA